jgi:hypothetical protein
MKDDSVLSITAADLRILAHAFKHQKEVIIRGGGAGWDRRPVIDFTVLGFGRTLRGDAAEAFWWLGIAQHPTEEEEDQYCPDCGDVLLDGESPCGKRKGSP